MYRREQFSESLDRSQVRDHSEPQIATVLSPDPYNIESQSPMSLVFEVVSDPRFPQIPRERSVCSKDPIIPVSFRSIPSVSFIPDYDSQSQSKLRIEVSQICLVSMSLLSQIFTQSSSPSNPREAFNSTVSP